MAMVGSCSSIPLPTNFPYRAELLNTKSQLDELFPSLPILLCQDQKSKLGHLNMGIHTVMANAVDVHQTIMYAQRMNVCVVHIYPVYIHSCQASHAK